MKNKSTKDKYNILMKCMKIYKELYNKYLNGDCTNYKINLYKEQFQIEICDDQILSLIEFFVKLDNEYKFNLKRLSNNVYSKKLLFNPNIINNNWDGFWLRATGIDSDLFINWLYSGLKYKNYQNKTLMYWYKKSHPNEKYVPYSIVKANDILKKIL